MNYEHTPVLLNEILAFLDARPGQNIVDATLGGGGYTSEILNKVGSGGKILAIDLDQDAVENYKLQITNYKFKDQIIVAQGNFAQIDKIISHHKFPAPDGIVADLGLSSYELEHRGISFKTDQPLDMRFDLSQPETAKFILNNYDEQRLRKVFEDYGEEKFSRQIARRVVGLRAKGEVIKHTADLYQLIVEALPKPVKHKADDSARRIFQALRIEVNHELENLKDFLPKAFDLLAPGGRLAVVSFHSLEDRIVKQYFVGLTKGCVCPPEFPQCLCGKNPKAKILTKKPITASAEELKKNSRAQPAKLRAIVKF
ncbi:MAG: 16S rRNA (cytosine(1402)-N(4))-methyltransferase RsmH [Candidatus Doudnabacteria bacterium]|nr:16S rRNA (cytosine(1402)-N(4))-methyltransferase RsmH [Candidatus Doudnabacteria bacterium]